MKRLSIFFVGLLSAVLIFSVVGLADEAASTTVSVTLNSVIDMEITQDLTDSDLDVDQVGGPDINLRDAGTYVSDFSSLTLTLNTLTPYKIAATYYNTSHPSGTPGTESTDGVITADNNDLSSYNGTKPGIGATELTDVVTAGTQTIGNGSSSPATHSIIVGFDLKDLTEDYVNGQSLTFSVDFWAYDTTT